VINIYEIVFCNFFLSNLGLLLFDQCAGSDICLTCE
jgi:hypothetical protein